MLAVFVERDDLDRNVPGQRIVLELAQHGPAEHVRQEDVERNRGRLELLGEIQRLGAARRDQHLEALVAGEIDQHARIMRIVLDDQKDGVAGFEIEPVVGDLLDRRAPGSAAAAPAPCCTATARMTRGATVGPEYFSGRYSVKVAALAGRALQMDFAAEQARQFAADRKAEAGAAIFAAGAGVGLLERLEDQLLLVLRDADAGIGHFEGDHRRARG